MIAQTLRLLLAAWLMSCEALLKSSPSPIAAKKWSRILAVLPSKKSRKAWSALSVAVKVKHMGGCGRDMDFTNSFVQARLLVLLQGRI